ncbi:hypothetical protein JVU11DRAFT_2624 [Chiua virens]|nr:hypothetical protein JVU11DRAFT_2624 [Chiua virens]
MFNQQASFSVQNFPLKRDQHDLSWSSSIQASQSPPDPPHSALPSFTTSTSPQAPLANLAKDRSEQELQLTQQTAGGFAACLAADHAAVLHPDVDTPFIDMADAVNRLLPYHVFQQPSEDLDSLSSRKRSKGKEKARHHEIRHEIEDTRFALTCYRRLKRLEDRLCRTKIKSGTRPCPDVQAYVLAQSILEFERSETATVSSELRNARSELDALQREKRATSAATSAHPTVTTFRPTYYPQAAASQYYRTYSYAYTPSYSTGAQGTSTFYTTPSTIPQTAATTSNTSYTPSTSPIPVQLPVTSLSALHALGIVPVPAASVPPPDQPQPAAVLKGSTSNGTMLSLDINVSLLQSAQMSGLAILLNSLMSRSTGTGHASATTSASPAPAAGQSLPNGSASAASGVPLTIQKEKDGTG